MLLRSVLFTCHSLPLSWISLHFSEIKTKGQSLLSLTIYFYSVACTEDSRMSAGALGPPQSQLGLPNSPEGLSDARADQVTQFLLVLSRREGLEVSIEQEARAGQAARSHCAQSSGQYKKKLWLSSASELCRPSDRRFLAK
jgi:hypothetical protein